MPNESLNQFCYLLECVHNIIDMNIDNYCFMQYEPNKSLINCKISTYFLNACKNYIVFFFNDLMLNNCYFKMIYEWKA
jgi:hypothetical protein